MGILIDTSVLVARERAEIRAQEVRGTWRGDEAFISTITASELLIGVHRSTNPVARIRRSMRVESFLDDFGIIPVELPVARIHAQLSADLAARGTPIGPNDLWIAASALAYGLAIATLNVREFQRVPGLTVEPWAL